MKILFWNTGKNDVDQALVDLIVETDADIIAVAEFHGNIGRIIGNLRCRDVMHTVVENIGCERIQMLSIFSPRKIRHKRDSERYTIKEFAIPGQQPLILTALHLPSKLNHSDDDQLLSASIARKDIEAAEVSCGHTNTVVIGDFNMNPFDKGMMSVSGFNAIPCSSTAARMSRKTQGKAYSFFYNPSWNLLGDRNESPGTYFHKNPGSLSHYWNTLDQVVVRPGLSTAVRKHPIRALSKTSTMSLVSSEGRPRTSDHLPILVTLDLQGVQSEELLA